jgi:hypothetical protein
MTATAAPTPAACNQAEFGRLHGWGKSYVTKLKLEGRLVFTDDGLVDVAASLAKIQANTGAPERASAPAVSPSTRSDRDRQAFYDAERSRLDLEERIGRLLDADQVLGAMADAAVTLRTALETWPERLSPELASLGGDEARIRARLADHVEAALEEISRRFADLATRKA